MSEWPGDRNDGADEPIDPRELFGDDWHDGQGEGTEPDDVQDIGDADQQLLRSLFTAAAQDPPPSTVTPASVIAAATGGTGEPETDRVPVVGGPAPVDELAARRRRRAARGGLLAAAVAAVLAVGIPVAISLNDRTANTADISASDSASSADTVAAAPERPAAGGAATSADGDEPLSEQAEAQPEATSAAAGGADTGGGEDAGEVGGAAQDEADDTAAEASSAAGTAGEGSADAGRSAETTQGAPAGPQQGGSADSADSSADETTATCQWPELPTSVDRAATDAVGPVVDGHRAYTGPCRPNRLGGAIFPAADGSRDAITVAVVRPAADGDCREQGCTPVDGGYAVDDEQSRTVWVYVDDLEITLTASAGIHVSAEQLVAMGTAIGAQVH